MSQHYEPNLMQHYRGRGLAADSTFYHMLKLMRAANNRFRETGKGNPPQFSPQEIAKAAYEWESLKRSLDKTTYPFGEDISRHFLGTTSKKRVVLVVEGVFYGDTNVPGVIGCDITDGVHEFFRSVPRRVTHDDYITQRKAYDFIEQERARLREKGFRFFEIMSSKFFFFNDEDLNTDYLRGRDGVNLEALLPLVTDVYMPKGGEYGFVNANQVVQPTFEIYSSHSPRFVSYRLKISTGEKSAKRLVQHETITLDDLIKDVAAHRAIVMDRNEVYRAVDSFGGIPIVGRSKTVVIGRHQVRILEVDDHYKKQDAKYKGARVNLLVETAQIGKNKVRAPTAREMQLVERDRHFHHEIDADDPAHRRNYERKKTSSQEVNLFYERYRKLLEEICGTESLLVPI